MGEWTRSEGADTLLTVWVVPGSSRSAIEGEHGGALKVRVAAPPERGRANRAVIDLLERRLGAKVSLVAGGAGRRKVLRVAGLNAEEVTTRLQAP